MAGLKELRGRIRSVRETQKITAAMMLVSGSKLRRAQRAFEGAEPYFSALDDALSALHSLPEGDRAAFPSLMGREKVSTHLLIVFSGARGLCGSFNTQIARQTMQQIESLTAQGRTVRLLPVGKKGYEQLKTRFGSLFWGLDEIALPAREIRDLAERAHFITHRVMEAFEASHVDAVSMVFGHFYSALSQIAETESICPLDFDSIPKPEASRGVYTFDPKPEVLVPRLIKAAISARVTYGLLQTEVSEHAARMMAMDGATRNAKDMMKRLQLVYNRSRQATITKELIEIISGAEALK